MKARLQGIWEWIHTSFWFFPALLSIAAFNQIRRHAEMIHRTSRDGLTEEQVLDDLDERFRELMRRLGESNP